MKILILGSTGFIGSNLYKILQKKKYNVFTAEKSSGIDIRDYKQIYSAIDRIKPDVIYNLASHGGSVHYVRNNSADVYQDNVLMAINLYKAESKINKKIKIIQPFSNCSYPAKSVVQYEKEWLDGDVHPSV